MKRKISVLLSVFFAFIALFAFVGCNGKGKNVAREKIALLIFRDNEIEGETMELIMSYPVYRDKITTVSLPCRESESGKGKYYYLFHDERSSGYPYGDKQFRGLQPLAAFDEAGKYEIVHGRSAWPNDKYTFVAWVFIEKVNSVTLKNFGDFRYEFDPCGAIEVTDVENRYPKGKNFVYKYDGETHYPKIKVFYKEKELPCRVEVWGRTNGEIGWETGYHDADGYVVNVDSYEINYLVFVDEDCIQAESFERTVFEKERVQHIFVDIVE